MRAHGLPALVPRYLFLVSHKERLSQPCCRHSPLVSLRASPCHSSIYCTLSCCTICDHIRVVLFGRVWTVFCKRLDRPKGHKLPTSTCRCWLSGPRAVDKYVVSITSPDALLRTCLLDRRTIPGPLHPLNRDVIAWGSFAEACHSGCLVLAAVLSEPLGASRCCVS
jgi:hypothetical protein